MSADLRVRYIDAIRVETAGETAEGTLFVDPAADYLADHFPGAPTLPGLVMLEGAVRVAAAVWATHPSGAPWAMLEHLDRLIVLRRVVPGETLVLRVALAGQPHLDTAWFTAEGAVGKRMAMRARFRLGTAIAAAGHTRER